MPLDFSRIPADQLQSLSAATTVFFFPVGPLEDHGPHLPLGLDLMEAEKLSRLAAERLEREMPGWVGVIMPGAPLGVNSHTTRLALTVRGHVLRDWLIDACRSLIRADFRHFVCLSGQLGPRQLTAIEEAGKSLNWEGPFTKLRRLLAPAGSPRSLKPVFVSASSALVSAREVFRAPFWPDPQEHGSRRDTSVALYLDVTVRNSSPPAEALPRHHSMITRTWLRFRGSLGGYWGTPSPSQGDATRGEQLLKDSLDDIFPKLRIALEGGRQGSLFRSWYSILPPNQSYFKAWLFATMILAVLIAWAYLSMQALFPKV